jgi:hypothetical protein
VTTLARALVTELDDDALAVLAERLVPHMEALMNPPERHARDDGWMDSKQAAEFLGMSNPALDKLAAARRIRSSRRDRTASAGSNDRSWTSGDCPVGLAGPCGSPQATHASRSLPNEPQRVRCAPASISLRASSQGLWYGHGWARTSDLSRVKRALSH